MAINEENQIEVLDDERSAEKFDHIKNSSIRQANDYFPLEDINSGETNMNDKLVNMMFAIREVTSIKSLLQYYLKYLLFIMFTDRRG